MKFALMLTILTLNGINVDAQTFAGNFNDMAHPGKCVYQGTVISPGDTYQPKGQCQRFFCANSDGRGNVHECSLQYVGVPCFLGKALNPNGQYPECCEREIICPKKRWIIDDKNDTSPDVLPNHI